MTHRFLALATPHGWKYSYRTRDHSEHRFVEGNLDFCFDLVKFGIPMGHMEEMSSMKLAVWLAVSRHFGLEIQLENLSTGLDVSTAGNGLDRKSRGPRPAPREALVCKWE